MCPIVDSYGPNEVGFILRESGARVLVVAAVTRGRSGVDVATDAGFEGTLVVLGADLPPAVEPLDALLGHGTLPAASVAAGDVALLVYTSGSTAAPKGVQHTHDTLLAGFRGAGPATGPALMGEAVAAFVRLEPGWDLTLDDVRRHFAGAGVPAQKIPEPLHVVDDLPRTAGKVLKSELRAWLR